MILIRTVCRWLLPVLTIFFVVVSIGGSCFTFSPELTIKALAGKTSLSAQESTWYRCEVEGKGRSGLTFEWWCTGGRLLDIRGDSVKWRAPDSSGIAILGVDVSDQEGRKARDSLVVSVKPRVVVFAYWEGAVKGRSYAFCADTALAGYRLSGQSWSDTRNVYLLFLDEDNFGRWQRQEEPEFLIQRFADDSRPFYDTIPTSGVYYLVLDNGRNLVDANFRVEIRLTSP